MSQPVLIVGATELEAAEKKAALRRGRNDGKYEEWKKFHDALRKVASRYGTVDSESDQRPDFYHSGDWFHALDDGFSIQSAKGLTTSALIEFQDAVRQYHRNAFFILDGDFGTPAAGLTVLITTSGIIVGWDGEDAAGCRRKLKMLGANLD